MLVVVIVGVVAHNLNKYGKSPSVCVCFSEDPPGTFLSFFFFFFKIPPLPLSYALPLMVMVMVMVMVFRKKHTSPRGDNSEDITVQGLHGPRSTTVPMSR